MPEFLPWAMATADAAANAPASRASGRGWTPTVPAAGSHNPKFRSDREMTMRAYSDSAPGPWSACVSTVGRPAAAEAPCTKGLAPQRLDELLLQSIAAGDKN